MHVNVFTSLPRDKQWRGSRASPEGTYLFGVGACSARGARSHTRAAIGLERRRHVAEQRMLPSYLVPTWIQVLLCERQLIYDNLIKGTHRQPAHSRIHDDR